MSDGTPNKSPAKRGPMDRFVQSSPMGQQGVFQNSNQGSDKVDQGSKQKEGVIPGSQNFIDQEGVIPGSQSDQEGVIPDKVPLDQEGVILGGVTLGLQNLENQQKGVIRGGVFMGLQNSENREGVTTGSINRDLNQEGVRQGFNPSEAYQGLDQNEGGIDEGSPVYSDSEAEDNKGLKGKEGLKVHNHNKMMQVQYYPSSGLDSEDFSDDGIPSPKPKSPTQQILNPSDYVPPSPDLRPVRQNSKEPVKPDRPNKYMDLVWAKHQWEKYNSGRGKNPRLQSFIRKTKIENKDGAQIVTSYNKNT